MPYDREIELHDWIRRVNIQPLWPLWEEAQETHGYPIMPLPASEKVVWEWLREETKSVCCTPESLSSWNYTLKGFANTSTNNMVRSSCSWEHS